MKTKSIMLVLGATLTLTACDRHPDTVVVSSQPQAQPVYVDQSPQPVYVQQPNTVVVERDHSGDVAAGVMTGMMMHHLLSGGSHYYNSPVQHTTIVNNHYNSVTNSRSVSVSKNTPSYAPKSSWFSSRSRSSVTVSSGYAAKHSYKSPFGGRR